MADDDLDYLESLLDAPFKANDSNGKQTSMSPPAVESKKHKEKDRENGSSHKSSRHRSRSRSKERRHKDKESKNEEKSKKDRRRSKDREREERKKDKSHSRDRKESEKDKDRSEKSKRGDKSRSKDKEREKRKRSKSRDNEKKRDFDDRRRDRGDRRDRVADRFRDRKRSRTPDRRRRRSISPPRPFHRGRTPPNGLGYRSSTPEILTAEERDLRTVFCMQLSQRVRASDLQEFFSSVGKVTDVRLITCNKTKRFKGIAYIEFKDPESLTLALGLSGQKLLGIPISVQHTQAEKNRLAYPSSPPLPPVNIQGPMRLYVGSLHFNITEEMLRGIFEPFGKIDNIQLIMDTETLRSKGYGFITYHNADDAKQALEQLNGFELAGRPMKVGNVTERLDVTAHASLDTDEMDRSGIDLGATGRLQLMFKLAEGAGLAVPQAAANALLASVPQPPAPIVEETPQIATQCFLLVNMFDPATETNMNWDQEIQDDVVEECNKHGGVLHVYVDVASSEGKVYVKCPSIATSVLSVNALHGRWFAGRVISAAYVPLVTYHQLFPDALTALNPLQMSRKP